MTFAPGEPWPAESWELCCSLDAASARGCLIPIVEIAERWPRAPCSSYRLENAEILLSFQYLASLLSCCRHQATVQQFLPKFVQEMHADVP